MDINFCLVVCNFNLKPLLYLLKFCRISSSLKVNQRKMSFVLSPAWLTSFWSTKACIHTFRHLTLIYLPEELRLVFIKRHFYRYKFSDTAYKQVITTNELIKKKKKILLICWCFNPKGWYRDEENLLIVLFNCWTHNYLLYWYNWYIVAG